MNEVYNEFKEHVMKARNISEEDLEKLLVVVCGLEVKQKQMVLLMN